MTRPGNGHQALRHSFRPSAAIQFGRGQDLLTLPKRPAGVPSSAPGAIDVGKLELGKFATLEEAQAWGRANYPHIDWDFTGAAIDAINPTMAQFDRLAQEFPEVAKRLEYIGTRQVKRPFY